MIKIDMMEKLLLLYIVINCVVVGLSADLQQCFRLKLGEVSCTESIGMKTVIKTAASNGNCLTKEDGKKLISLVETQSKMIQTMGVQMQEFGKKLLSAHSKELEDKKRTEAPAAKAAKAECSNVKPSDRLECGYPGITPVDCESNPDCCFDNSIKGVKWCFYKQSVAAEALKTGRTCKDILTKHPKSANGVYNLVADGKSFKAYCDMTEGGWVVFQRRFDGTTNFHQNFAAYVKGFGNTKKEYWLGLDTMHKLTKSRKWTLKVDLEDFKGVKASAKYSKFKIGEGIGYKLMLDKFLGGGAGDSLSNQKNQYFSTFDKDQDSWSKNCAIRYTGAWWFNKCHKSNLNANLYGPKVTQWAKGMNWDTFKGYYKPMKKTTMKIMEE